MATIGQRLFVSLQKKYLTLANEEFVRTLGIGTNWTKLRLGILWAITPDGTNALPSSAIVLGLCSGKTNPYGAANTTNFVGAELHTNAPNSTTGSLTYSVISGQPWYTSSGSWPATRVGATISSASGQGNTFLIATNTGSIQRRSPLFVDIQKGSPNYTITRWLPQSSTTAYQTADMSPAEFLSSLELATPTWVNIALTGSVGTIATSEGPGVFDTFDFFWNKSLFPAEIYAVAVYRFS